MNLVFPICFILSLLLATRTQTQSDLDPDPPTIDAHRNSTNQITITLMPVGENITYRIAYREYNGPSCPEYDSENYTHRNTNKSSYTLSVDPDEGICLTALVIENGRESAYAEVIFREARSTSPWDIKLKALVGGGGGVVLLLALITCGAMICLCWKTNRRGRSKRHEITVEARNQLADDRGEIGESETESSRPIVRGGNLTVSFEWHMQDALKYLENVPDEPIAMEEVDRGARVAQTDREEPELEQSQAPPLPDREYLQDLSFVERLKPENTANAVQAVPLPNSGAINVTVDWNVQSCPQNSNVSQTPASRSQESIGNPSHPEMPNPLHVGCGYPKSVTHSQVQSSLPDIQSEATSVGDTRYVPTRHGLYTQMEPSSLNCKQFGSNIEIPVSTFHPQSTTYQSSIGVLQLNLPPVPFVETPPRIPPKRIKRPRPKLEETAVQDDLQALVPLHHMIPAIKVDLQQENQDPNKSRESTPDADLPPTWIDRSVTLTEPYFELRHESTSGMTWPSAGKELQSQKENYAKFGSGDNQETLC